MVDRNRPLPPPESLLKSHGENAKQTAVTTPGEPYRSAGRHGQAREAGQQIPPQTNPISPREAYIGARIISYARVDCALTYIWPNTPFTSCRNPIPRHGRGKTRVGFRWRSEMPPSLQDLARRGTAAVAAAAAAMIQRSLLGTVITYEYSPLGYVGLMWTEDNPRKDAAV